MKILEEMNTISNFFTLKNKHVSMFMYVSDRYMDR